MKLLFTSLGGTYPFRIGGPSVVAYNLVKQLALKGIEIDFVYGISKYHYAHTQWYPSFRFSENVNLVPVIKNRTSPGSYKTPVDAFLFADGARLLKRLLNDCDLIHFCNIPSSKDVFLPPLAAVKGVPSVFNFHGWITNELRAHTGFRWYHDYLSFRLLKRFFGAVVCNSVWMRKKALLEGISEEKIHVIPNGVNSKMFTDASEVTLMGHPALLFVGRLDTEKGIDVLVRSMEDLTQRLPDAVLHVVGEGPLMPQLKDFVNSAALGERVLFHGKVLDTLPAMYRSADICVFPSVYDAAPITCIEAMAAGKPVIATKAGGIPEYVRDSENGILVNLDESHLVEAIDQLWRDRELLGKMGKTNFERAQRFDWARIAEQYMKVYTNLT